MNIKDEYIKFFESKNHQKHTSAPLVPDDATLLFTNAGMVAFKDVFTGVVPAPNNRRATSSQLCLRAGGKHNDLENVGYTSRHHTLFEMLGNFSFGDYFKEEAISYAWEFVTEVIKLPIDKLWVTVHKNDDEAYELWTKHITNDRIVRFGDKDNFWQMGDTGACGPSSEIFYDQGEENFNLDEDYLGGEGDRFLEIWNLVFMQYDKDKDGNLHPLPKPSIDTGMGLERVVAIKEGVYNNFDSSLFKPMIDEIIKIVGVNPTDKSIGSYRVIADHIRAVSHLLSQGVLFDKEGRGYVLRRILRRAVRHGYLLGLREPFMSRLVPKLVEMMGSDYEDLKNNQKRVIEQILLEEERFFKTIHSGMLIFEDEIAKGDTVFDGEVAFKLYDTYGFPLDLTQDMLKDKGIEVDIVAYNSAMQKQRESSKANWKGSGDSVNDGDFSKLLESYGINEFVGYKLSENQSEIVAILDDDFTMIDSLKSGQNGWIMLKQTPFYATSGGQVGDIGVIGSNEAISIVYETKKFHGLNLSYVKMQQEQLSVGDKVESIVIDRDEVAKHHSATHLLQSALKQVLGNSVGQAGSLNDATKLRFDFTYPKALTDKELEEVEQKVNDMILDNIKNTTKELPIKEAKKSGAIAMFGQKYGDIVRVVDFEGESVEFCGGTHVAYTSQIGSFYIIKESGVSAGVRRIEAVVGKSAIEYAKSFMNTNNNLQNILKTKDLTAGVNRLKEQIKALKAELKDATTQETKELHSKEINSVSVVVEKVVGGDIKQIIDDMKNSHDKIAIMLIEPKDDRVMIACGIKGCDIKAGNWIKQIAPIVGGGGGGRADFAQAGGKDVSKIDDALKASLLYLEENL